MAKKGIVSRIMDYLGRPVKTGDLSKEYGEPSITGVRTVWHDSVANALTPAQLGNILLEVDQGDSQSYLTLAEEMEERFMHYGSVLATRKRAVTSLPTMVESVSDEERDIEIADAVRSIVETDAFDSMLPRAMDAIGKGYSATEIMWDRSGSTWKPKKYVWRDPRFFQFDLETSSELRMRDEADLVNGLELPPFKFIVHEPIIKAGRTLRGGLARAVCTAYMLQGYTLKDWMAFMEVFGMPWRIGKYSAAATSDQKTALLTAIRQMGVDAAGIIRDDTSIDIIESSKSTGGDKLFIGASEWLNDQVSKVVLGQIASTKGTPGRLGNEDNQENVRDDIMRDDAKQLSATLRRDLVKPFVDLNFGPQERYPKLRLVVEEPEDLESLAKSLPEFIDRGLEVEKSVIRDKFNLPEPEDGADILKPKSGGPSPVPGGGGPEPEPEEPPTEEELEQEQSRAIRAIWRRIAKGEPVTGEERQLLVAQIALMATDKE